MNRTVYIYIIIITNIIAVIILVRCVITIINIKNFSQCKKIYKKEKEKYTDKKSNTVKIIKETICTHLNVLQSRR